MELIFFQNLALFCFWFVIGVSLVVTLKQYKITSHLNRSSLSPGASNFFSYFNYKNKKKVSQKEWGSGSLRRILTTLPGSVGRRGEWANINQIPLSKVFKGKAQKSSLLASRQGKGLKRGSALSFLKKKINKHNQYLLKILQAFEELTFLNLFLIFFILFFIYKIIFNLLLVLILKFFYFYGHINDELLLKHPINIDILNQCMANDNSTTLPVVGEELNTRDLSIRIASAASDGGIMATAIAAGAKLAAKAPTPATKIAATLGGVGLGALAIGTKNIMSNVTSDMGKNNTYINLDFFNLFPPQVAGSGLPFGEGGQNLFNLTGNSALDLIHMLVLFQLLQLLFLSIIIYNSIIMLINEDYIEKLLLRFLPFNKTIRGYILK
jgi:hypothetical protein